MKPHARLTIDMSVDEHTCLKMASAELGLTMREFMLLAAFEKIEEFNDPWMSKQAGDSLSRLGMQKEPRRAP